MPLHASDDLNALSLPALYARFASTGLISRLIALARDEDLGVFAIHRPGEAEGVDHGIDITTAACVSPHRRAVANIDLRESGVIAAAALLPELVQAFAPSCELAVIRNDGDAVRGRTTVATLSGPLDEMLEFERTALNFLGRLSGIATRTARFVAAIPAGSRARLYDTRKTTPGMRLLEKYAVRCGGGFCHRIGLHDAVLIKDNHIAGVSTADLPGYIRAASERIAAIAPTPPAFFEVEVDSLEQFRALLTLPRGVVDIVLLDNMGPKMLRQAAAMRDEHNPDLRLEASGGITLETIAEIASTGVDRISTGSVTHSAVSLDVGMDVTEVA